MNAIPPAASQAVPALVGDELESPTLIESDYTELDDPAPAPQPITYSGSDFDVEGLVRRLGRGDIIVPTFGHQDPTVEAAGFQRNFVWRRAQMDKFIESLLLGFPVRQDRLLDVATHFPHGRRRIRRNCLL